MNLFILELIVVVRDWHIGFISGKRGKNRGSVSVRRRRKRGFNMCRGNYGLKKCLGKFSGAEFRVEEIIGGFNIGTIKIRDGIKNSLS